jgi:hypothetical protein
MMKADMLAYVFWHFRRENVVQADYERDLRIFHEILSAHPPAGFLRSWVSHLQGVPWLGGVEGYEDWYLLEESAALDRLEAGSVSGKLEEPHRGIARLAAGGTAGLYNPLGSGAVSMDAPTAVWFGKPAAMSYTSMLTKLEKHNPEIRDRLWQRKMTLGPTPEFCLLQSGPDFLPYGWESTMVVRRPIKL